MLLTSHRVFHPLYAQVKFSWTMGMILYELLFPRPPEPATLLPLFLACFVGATALLLAALVSAHCVARRAAASYRRLAQQALAASEAAERASEGGGEGVGDGGGKGFRFSNQRGDDGWEWGEGGEGVGRLEEPEEEGGEDALEALRRTFDRVPRPRPPSTIDRIPSIARAPSAPAARYQPAHAPAEAPDAPWRRRSQHEVRRLALHARAVAALHEVPSRVPSQQCARGTGEKQMRGGRRSGRTCDYCTFDCRTCA
jgi:hypothetical protein